MVFSSLQFIFIFLPVFLMIYGLCPVRWKNLVILAASIIFYGIGSYRQPVSILLFLISIGINYVIGLRIDGAHGKRRKGYLRVGLLIDFGWLFLFKYFGFLLSELPLRELQKLQWNLELPLGISFYTFQMVSYLFDVYRKEELPEKSIINFSTYIAMFPQLIAGPIVTYGKVRGQIKKKRVFHLSDVSNGLQVFIFGLGCKVLIANQMGSMWKAIQAIGFESISTPLAWLGIFAFSFQIYFDFWGYSLMAIGLGKMMQIDLPQNFRNPYMSVSVTEFWRRWHITLGEWFQKYLYIPLGGNRTSKIKWIRNLFVVWLFTGIWHGAGWNFLLWGIFLFALILIEKIGLKKYLDKYRSLGHLYLWIVVPLTWMVFAITDCHDLAIYFSRLFSFGRYGGQNVFVYDYLKYLREFGVVLFAAGICSTPVPLRIFQKIKNTYVGFAVAIILFWMSVYCLYIGLNDPFLYFRF